MRSIKLLIAIALCLCLSVVASAHPGRTDSSGGHTDHSTGEYHYHHGYSAHQHSDMDGDGNLDCPYSFDDKTGSSGSKTESSGNKPQSSQNETKPLVIKNEPKKETTKKRTTLEYIGIGICILLDISLLKALIRVAVDEIKKGHKK